MQSVYCTQVEDSRKLILYVSDRTKEGRNQDQLSEALQMAKADSEAKTAFLGSVSHDIRTPMNAIIHPQAKAKDQTFEITVSPMNYERVQGDKLRINQILINLLSNSVKYTPAGGKIEMRVEELPKVMKKHNRVRFTVRDNGMGISEEYLKVSSIPLPGRRLRTPTVFRVPGWAWPLPRAWWI